MAFLNKKILSVALCSAFLLGACQKPADNADANAQSEATSADRHHDHAHGDHDHHDHDHHDHDHHDHHDHAHDHDHHHHDHGVLYACDNGASIRVDLRDHEGESEATVTIDDIAYDLPQSADNPTRYTTSDGPNHEGLSMDLSGSGVVFQSLDGKTTYFSCQKRDPQQG